MPLTDMIEQFIKDLMTDSQSEVELKRNELASYFGCAPSQINYVLSTRFSPNHGYLIQSRRGGSGYVRIIRILADDPHNVFIHQLLEQVGPMLTVMQAKAMIQALSERGILDASGTRLMLAATADEAINLPINAKDMLRAGIMKSMLTALLSRRSDEHEM